MELSINSVTIAEQELARQMFNAGEFASCHQE